MARLALAHISIRFVSRALRAVIASSVFCICIGGTPGYAQKPAPPAVVPPDFSGFWGHTRFNMEPPYVTRDGQVIGGYANEILHPWTVEAVMRDYRAKKAGDVVANANITCWPDGLTNALALTEMQILQTPTEIIFLYTDNQQVRFVYLNENHLPSTTQRWYGDSVGHFEGDTLVVDTIGFTATPQVKIDHYGTPVTEGLHVVERYRFVEGATATTPAPAPGAAARRSRDEGRPDNLIASGKTLELVFTVEDPRTFRMPWSKTVNYKPFEGPLAEYYCAENNRDWAHLMPVAAKPDF
jgi:hypothetical protein